MLDSVIRCVYNVCTVKEKPDKQGAANMTKITKQYTNTNNGGRERITRDGDNYYISSDFGKGFSDQVKVSRRDAERCMAHTNAPASVVSAILGTEVAQ